MTPFEKFFKEVVEEIEDRRGIDKEEAESIAKAHTPTIIGGYDRQMTAEEVVNLIYGQTNY